MKERLIELATEAIDAEVYPSKLFPPSRYYRFLRLLARELKPRLSVELGVCGGGGSLHMAQGYTAGRVIGVDFQWDHAEQIEHIQDHYTNFTFLLDDSVKAAPKVGNDYGKVDILFIDTDHTYQRTIDEYTAWKPFLNEGAVVCFDDLFRPGMKEAWDKVKGKNHVRIDHLHEGQYPEGGGFGCVW